MTISIRNLTTLTPSEQLPLLYWQSATYDVYTGHGWSTSVTQSSFYEANQPIQANHATGFALVEQDVFPVKNLGGSIYAAGEPVNLNIPSEAAWRSQGDLFGLRAMGSTDYQVFSLIPVADVAALRSASQDYPDWVRQNFLALPKGIPARVKALAIQLTDSQPTVFDRALAMENYLRTYPYSLDVPIPPKQQDLVDYFLFNLKKGYCDYYATAMVVLAREAGIPARLATGYANGTYNLNSKRYIVTEADAHSWVEVYFPSIGWVPFEPTAASPRLEGPGQLLPAEIPGSNPTHSVNNSQPANILFSGWQPLFGLIILAVIIGMILVISRKIYSHQLSEATAAALIYARLKHYGGHLSVAADLGATPYEFSASLEMNIRSLLASRKWISHAGYLERGIEKLVEGINLASYSPASSKDVHLLRQWNKLRWQLSAVWLLKTWNGIISYLKIKGKPTGTPSKGQV